jgi:cobalt-zinc-cadmium efflux system outer membrane protein
VNPSFLRPVLLVAVLPLAGCATQRYKASPIVPTETASKFLARNFRDPGLQVFIEKNLGQTATPSPTRTWDLQSLWLAAQYFSPAMDVAGARMAEADAAVVTAGARPNPTLSIAPGIPSPYLFNLDLSVPIETAGKRWHRIQSAKSLDQAAQLDLADWAWKVRSGVRAALLNYLLASRNLDLLRSENDFRREQVSLLERRLAVGEIPRPDVDLARIELSKTQLTITTTEGQVSETKAALAASIGVPVAALEAIAFSWGDLDSPPSTQSLSSDAIQREAVLNRLDVRRSLALYAAAESDLQLEISKQYPDLQIGPGYTYEEHNNFFTVGLSTTLPVLNRNQGPIAEAEARRKEAAATFLAKQARVVAESEQALALYTAALTELTQSDQSLRTLQNAQVQTTQQAVQLGEEDRLAINAVQIQSSEVARMRVDALSRAQTALGALEDAVQRPLDSVHISSSNSGPSPLNNLPKELQR